MFFADDRTHFFRPLTSKYRAQIMECLRGLYTYLYSSVADYRRSLNRDQLLEIFQEALARAPLLEEEGDAEFLAPARAEREQANWILNQLLDNGWLEKHHDEATLQSTYAFSRVGRLFTQPMVETAGSGFRTRHRNTRNTRNALGSFLDKGDVYDLLDAFEHSERIISDFSDVIAELDERKRQLVRDVEAQQLVRHAGDEFFDFMEKRFMPDLAVRLSADSVEKYRDEIQTLIQAARRKRKEFKAEAERELRKMVPELVGDPQRSLYLMILDGIENRMHSAASIMLPALRHALNSFTRRADIIIRQLSYASTGQQNQLVDICKQLSELPPEEQEARLTAAGRAMAGLSAGVVDPGSLRLHSGRIKRVVNTQAEQHGEADPDARKQLFVQQAVESAFAVNNRGMRDYIASALASGQAVSSANLPVRDARELLMSAHAIEVGAANGSSEYRFRITPSGERVATDYFDGCDEFVIELEERHVDGQ